jgi:hypothetical protein
MESEFIASYGFLPPTTDLAHPLDFLAAHKALTDTGFHELDAFARAITGDHLNTGKAGLVSIYELISTRLHDLQEAIDSANRDHLLFATPDGSLCLISGGMSRGTDPSPSFRALSELALLPSIWSALGFYSSSWVKGRQVFRR